MARELNAARGVTLPSEWINRTQEAASGEAWGVTLVQVDSDTVAVHPVDVGGEDRAGLRIGGHPRWVDVPVSLTISGAAGTKDVFAVRAALPAVGFTLSTSAGAGRRKIGEVDWDGSAIKAVRTTLAVSGHGLQHRADGPDPLPGEPWCSASTASASGAFGGATWSQGYSITTIDASDGTWTTGSGGLVVPVSGVYAVQAEVYPAATGDGYVGLRAASSQARSPLQPRVAGVAGAVRAVLSGHVRRQAGEVISVTVDALGCATPLLNLSGGALHVHRLGGSS